MFNVFARSLGSDGSCVYRTPVGDFFVYPASKGGWFAIWELSALGRYRDMRTRPMPRKDIMEWIEAAQSFA